MTSHASSARTWLWIALYPLLSCIVIGLVSIYIGRTEVEGQLLFDGQFLSYAVPFPGFPGLVQLPGLILGLSIVALMAISCRSDKPAISIFQVRVLITIALWLTVVLQTIFLVETPTISLPYPPWSLPITAQGLALMAHRHLRLLFISIHLTTAFFFTFVPFMLGPPNQRLSIFSAGRRWQAMLLAATIVAIALLWFAQWWFDVPTIEPPPILICDYFQPPGSLPIPSSW